VARSSRKVASARARTLPPKVVTAVELAVVLGLPAAGLFASQGPRVFYGALAQGFALIALTVLAGAALVTFLCERTPRALASRIQGPRRGSALLGRGARDTALAAWVAACLLAWPLARMHAGEPTGLVWTVDAAGGPVALVLQNLGGILVLDAWLYWKHRLLHTRLSSASTRATTSTATHPARGLRRGPGRGAAHVLARGAGGPARGAPLWPRLLHAGGGLRHPQLLPALRRGVARPRGAVAAPQSVNTSTHHNRHHQNADTHFAEALTLWDRLMGTREAAAARRA
jgi:hypothetical protein